MKSKALLMLFLMNIDKVLFETSSTSQELLYSYSYFCLSCKVLQEQNSVRNSSFMRLQNMEDFNVYVF